MLLNIFRSKRKTTHGGSGGETVRKHQVEVQQRPWVTQDGVRAHPPAAVAYPHTQLRDEGEETNGVQDPQRACEVVGVIRGQDSAP